MFHHSQHPGKARTGPTAARTAPGSPSSWSLGVCPVLEGRKIPPRRPSRALQGKEDTRGAHLAWGHIPPFPTSALQVQFPPPYPKTWPLAGLEQASAVPYRRRGLQTWPPTVTLGTPSPWEKRTKDRSSPSSWDLCVERKTSGTPDCKECGQGSAPSVPAARRGAESSSLGSLPSWRPSAPSPAALGGAAR